MCLCDESRCLPPRLLTCPSSTAPQQREGQFSSLQLVAMQRGVAAAMQYLSSFAFVHRALSAHSVLVNSHLVCKVARLGHSPQVRASLGGPASLGGWGCWRTSWDQGRWMPQGALESEGAELTRVMEQTPGEGAQRDIREGLRPLRKEGSPPRTTPCPSLVLTSVRAPGCKSTHHPQAL